MTRRTEDDGGAGHTGPDPTPLDVCAVSDALDRLGLSGVVFGLHSATSHSHRVRGRVRTVSVAPPRDDAPRPHICATTVMAAGPGDVIVVGNRGRLDVSCWGGLLSLAARQRRIEGVVVDGACRDVAEAEELGFAVFARASTPRTARGRLVEESIGQPIVVGSVEVRNGDLVFGDSTGVVFVPEERAEQVLNLARQIAAREERMADALRQGQSIIDVMHDEAFGHLGSQQ